MVGRDGSNRLCRQDAGVEPEQPLNLYPRTTIVQTRVKSVSPLSETSALVRFETIRRDDGAQPQPALSWVAVVEYRFSGEPMAAEDRFLNPLGFQVTRYRRDPETLTPPPPALHRYGRNCPMLRLPRMRASNDTDRRHAGRAADRVRHLSSDADAPR